MSGDAAGAGGGTDWTSLASTLASSYLSGMGKAGSGTGSAQMAIPAGSTGTSPMGAGGGPLFGQQGQGAKPTDAMAQMPKIPQLTPEVEKMIQEFIRQKMAGQYGPGGTPGFGGPLQSQ